MKNGKMGPVPSWIVPIFCLFFNLVLFLFSSTKSIETTAKQFATTPQEFAPIPKGFVSAAQRLSRFSDSRILGFLSASASLSLRASLHQL